MITETVLEMHFHRPLMDALRNTLGLGSAGTLNFYKYSPQRECFVGFDQAYAKSELSEADFFHQLKTAAKSSGYAIGNHFIGYFLQFKVVKEMAKRSRYTPPSIRNTPHYRVSLGTTKNIKTGLTQHELLRNLNSNPGALVYYACPMLFERSALYAVNVDLDKLRLAELDSCPSDYSDNDNHFIFFENATAQPIWCSEPVEGRATSPQVFFSETLRALAQSDRRQESASKLLKALTDFETAGIKAESATTKGFAHPSLLPFVGELLTVVKISRHEDQEKFGEMSPNNAFNPDVGKAGAG